VLKIAFDIERS